MACISYHHRPAHTNTYKKATNIGGTTGNVDDGLGGTGKKHVVKAIQCIMDHYGCGYLICFLTLTESAAGLIDRITIHKALEIKIKSNWKGKENRIPGEDFKNYIILIVIKECMRLHNEWKNMEYILSYCCSALSCSWFKVCKREAQSWFGDVAVIFTGGFFQYPPVGDVLLYTPISWYARTTNKEIQNRLGCLVWKTVNIHSC